MVQLRADSDASILESIEATAANYAVAPVLRFHIAVDEVRLVAGGRQDLLAQSAAAFISQASDPGLRSHWTPLAAAICLQAAASRETPDEPSGRCTLR